MAEASIGSVVIDVNDLARMKDFWSEALDYKVEFEGEDWIKLSDPHGEAVNVSLQLVPEPRDGKNRLHLDLYSHEPQAEVERIASLGAEVVRPRGEGDDFAVLADPEGNLFCVIDKNDA